MVQILKIACDALSVLQKNQVKQDDRGVVYDKDAIKALILLTQAGHQVDLFQYSPVDPLFFMGLVNEETVPLLLEELWIEGPFEFTLQPPGNAQDHYHLVVCGADFEGEPRTPLADTPEGQAAPSRAVELADNVFDGVKPEFEWCPHIYACSTMSENFAVFIQEVLANPQGNHVAFFEQTFGEIPKPPGAHPTP